MGTALSTTGNKHHTPCLIGVATSPLNPHPPHLVMGSSAEENDGVRVRGEQCVYSSGAHCICRRMMRMCALECVCVYVRAHARASVCERICKYLRGFVVCRCVTKCVCACMCVCKCLCVCLYVSTFVYACMRACSCVCSCVYVCM